MKFSVFLFVLYHRTNCFLSYMNFASE